VLKKIQQQLSNQDVDGRLVEALVNLALETLSSATLADGELCRKSIIELLGAELPVHRAQSICDRECRLCDRPKWKWKDQHRCQAGSLLQSEYE
jgi:hypothetical protein